MGEQDPKRKVALVGTSNVGKTSVIEELKEKYGDNPEVAFVEEAATIYFTSHPEIPEDLRFSFQHQSQIQELARQLEQNVLASGASRLLTDRSVLDAVVYVNEYGDEEGAKELMGRARDWVDTYSNIVLLSPEGVPYEKKGVRQEEEWVRTRNHEGFPSLFLREGISYTLLGGSLEERIQTVEAMLLQ